MDKSLLLPLVPPPSSLPPSLPHFLLCLPPRDSTYFHSTNPSSHRTLPTLDFSSPCRTSLANSLRPTGSPHIRLSPPTVENPRRTNKKASKAATTRALASSSNRTTSPVRRWDTTITTKAPRVHKVRMGRARKVRMVRKARTLRVRSPPAKVRTLRLAHTVQVPATTLRSVAREEAAALVFSVV
jgi:hypothetical protein